MLCYSQTFGVAASRLSGALCAIRFWVNWPGRRFRLLWMVAVSGCEDHFVCCFVFLILESWGHVGSSIIHV